MTSNFKKLLIIVIMFFSGFCSLVYEVLWSRHLALIFGSTAYAHALIFALFFIGLAAGYYYWGKSSKTVTNNLRFYSYLEIFIGLVAMISPFILKFLFLTPLPFLVKGLLSTALILSSTFAMGGTLLFLIKYMTHSSPILSRSIALVYFVNSMGAAIGAFVSGFYFISTFGLISPLYGVGAFNIVLGLLAISISREKSETISMANDSQQLKPSEALHVPTARNLLYLLIFCSGFSAITYELLWIRVLTIVLGGSSYSLSVMLSAFIAGTAVGSAVISRTHFKSPIKVLALAQLGVSLSLLLSLPFYDRLPFYFAILMQFFEPTESSFYWFELSKFLFCFILMIIPCIFIGMTLPLASSLGGASPKKEHSIGMIFSINTIGNVLSALLSGLVLLPVLGIKNLFLLGIALNLFAGQFFYWYHFKKSKIFLALNSIAVLIILSIIPKWDLIALSSNNFRKKVGTAVKNTDFMEYAKQKPFQSVLFYEDDPHASVAIFAKKKGASLIINGKPDGSLYGDLSTQILLGQLPFLLGPQAQKVLIIGLGTGITAGSTLSHDVERVDTVEISPAVIAGAKFFSENNNNVLSDPRSTIHNMDANKFFDKNQRQYDLIISEPSNPWLAGVGNLFSREFYGLVKNHLSDSGVFAQWFHLYEMSDSVFQVFIRTFLSVFPDASIWRLGQNDILLIGGKSSLSIDASKIETSFKNKNVLNNLKLIGINKVSSLLYLQLGSYKDLKDIAGTGPVNSLYNPIIEYEAPKSLYLKSFPDSISKLTKTTVLPHQNSAFYLQSFLKQKNRDLTYEDYLNIVRYLVKEVQPILLENTLNEWLKLYPGDKNILYVLRQFNAIKYGKEPPLEKLEEFLKKDPQNLNYLKQITGHLFNDIQTQKDKIQAAIKLSAYLEQMLALSPDQEKVKIYMAQAKVFAVQDKNKQALQSAKKGLSSAYKYNGKLTQSILHYELGKLYFESREFKKAKTELMKSVELNSQNNAAINLLKRL